MSELKTRFIDDTYVEYYNTGKHDLAQVYLKTEADKVIAEKDKDVTELKAEAERLKRELDKSNEIYAIRRKKLRATRRALWLARANSAEGQLFYWWARFAAESGFTKTDIRGYTVNTKRRLRTIGEWIETWKNVKIKCLKKAEEYK